MKKFFFTFVLTAICGMVLAQSDKTPSLTIENISIQPGETASFTLVVNVGDLDVKGFQYEHLTLPEGLTVTKNSTANIAGGTISVGDNKALYTNMSGNPIPKNQDFEIGTIELQAAADMEEKDYTVSFPAGDFKFLDGTNYFPVENEVSFTVTVKKFETIVLKEDNTEDIPTKSDVNVEMYRTIAANEWSTICLPFSMTETQVKNVFGDDVKLAELTDWAYEGKPTAVTKLSIIFTPVAVSAGIEANHPYMIWSANAISEFFKVSSVNLTPDPDALEIPINKTINRVPYYFTMVGNYTTTTLFENDFFVSGNKMWYNDTEGATTIKAFRASFYTNLGLSFLSSDSRITMEFDGTTDGIDAVETSVQDDEYYNLNGLRVEKPSKGIYIKNGKKVVVK